MLEITDILQYDFARHALLGSLLASISCALIGTYIVTRRLVFISGGLTHASFGGIGIGLYAGVPPILSAALFAILSALGIEWMSRREDVREDSAIAVFWTLGMSVGVIFSYLTPGFASDLSAYLFGNILTIGSSDLWFIGGVTALLSITFALFMRPIVHMAFDREFALSKGLPVTAMEYAMMTLIALTIVACLRIVGIVLVISLLTIPQTTANLFTHSYKKIVALSVVLSFLSCIGGLLVSYYYNIPSGATIIFVTIMMYAVGKVAKHMQTAYKKQ